MAPKMPLWLSEADVRAALSMDKLIEAMERALSAFSAGRVVQPVRTVVELKHTAFFLMAACDDTNDNHAGLLGAKLLTVVEDNPARGLPSHQALVALFHPATGELLAVADGRYITGARTAAVSAVSVRHMARADAPVLAIIGSGVQARSHLEALPLVRRFREIRVWSPNAERLRHCVECAGGCVRAAQTAEQAVRGAQIVVLATSSSTPVIEDAWVGPGTHVISVGAPRPTQRELDPALLARSLLVVDSRAAALQESGDVLMGMREGRFGEDHIHAELGQVASGLKQGRTAADQITTFKSLGLAIEDVVSAGLAYRGALENGRGVQVPL
jgi:alanine dehydrogenase